MTQTRVGLIPLALLSFFVATSPATADESRIIRGSIDQVADSIATLSMLGTGGVKLDATFNGSYGGLFWDYVCPYTTCLPGDVVSLRSSYASFLGSSGQLTVRGQTYDLWYPYGLRAQLVFDAAIVLPEFTESGTAEMSVPFTFSGSIPIPNEEDPGTSDDLELYGSGVATAALYVNPYTFAGWIVGSVRFDFVPRQTDIPR
jgi:hypothetical protein